jgi:hypothetical protein
MKPLEECEKREDRLWGCTLTFVMLAVVTGLLGQRVAPPFWLGAAIIVFSLLSFVSWLSYGTAKLQTLACTIAEASPLQITDCRRGDGAAGIKGMLYVTVPFEEGGQRMPVRASHPEYATLVDLLEITDGWYPTLRLHYSAQVRIPGKSAGAFFSDYLRFELK